MIKLEVEITLQGNKHTIQTTQRDVIACEQHFETSILDFRSTYVLYLAFAALKRTGKYEGDWDSFVDLDPDFSMETLGQTAPLEAEAVSQEAASPSHLQADLRTAK